MTSWTAKPASADRIEPDESLDRGHRDPVGIGSSRYSFSRVRDGREHEGERQPDGSDEAANVEERKLLTKHVGRRFPQGDDVTDGEQDAQFGRTHLEEAHPERAQDVRGQEHLHRQHEVRDEEQRGDPRRHVSREAHAPDEQRDPEFVDDVIDVEAVARPLALAHACQRAVQAVAEPVQGQTDGCGHEPQWVGAGPPVRQPGAEHRHERQDREVVGVDAPGHPFGEPDQRPLLDWGENTGEVTGGILVSPDIGKPPNTKASKAGEMGSVVPRSPFPVPRSGSGVRVQSGQGNVERGTGNDVSPYGGKLALPGMTAYEPGRPVPGRDRRWRRRRV